MCDLYREEESEGGRRLGIIEFVDELVVAATNTRIYWHDHPRVKSSIATLMHALAVHFEGGVDQEIVIGAADGCLFHDQRPLLGASLSAPKIIDRLTELQSGGIAFSRVAQERDFQAVVELLGRKQVDHADAAEANRELEQRGCTAIRFLPTYQRSMEELGLELTRELGERAAADSAGVGSIEVPVTLYQNTVALLQDAMVRVCHGDEIDVEGAKGYVSAILSRLKRDTQSMMKLARYERYDAYTFGHSIRVAFLALDFARTMIADENLLLRIGVAALLHDIGKARVPFEILHSTERLTPEERAEMNLHTLHGGEILLQMEDADPLVVASAFGHHRTEGRGGYPETPFQARQAAGTKIVKICDVYEALTAVRPYKPRMSPIRAYRAMMSMRDHFDPGLLRRFVTVNGLYPVGSEVILSTGARALVIGQTRSALRPVVRLLDESDGKPWDLSTDAPHVAVRCAVSDGVQEDVLRAA